MWTKTVRRLAILLVIISLVGGTAFAIQRWQVNRLAKSLVDQAERAASEGDFSKAEQLYRQHLEVFPEDREVPSKLADVLLKVDKENPRRRDEAIGHLKARGIETRPYFFPPVHEQGFFRKFADRALPRTEKLSRQVITLPFYTKITEAEMDYVAGGLGEAERELG